MKELAALQHERQLLLAKEQEKLAIMDEVERSATLAICIASADSSACSAV